MGSEPNTTDCEGVVNRGPADRSRKGDRRPSAGRPYNLACRCGRRRVRAGVKGLSRSRGPVILTRREVDHGSTADCRMMIVSDVEVVDTETGPRAKGGTVEVWDPWEVVEGRMTPSPFDDEPPALPDWRRGGPCAAKPEAVPDIELTSRMRNSSL